MLEKNPHSEERHALAVLDAFSPKRYDDYWTPKPDTVWDSTHRWTGCAWKDLNDAAGVALVLPLKEGAAFCIFGDASGFRHDYTTIKEHTFVSTTHEGPKFGVRLPGTIGRSAGSTVRATGWMKSSMQLFPNCFSPMGMDFYALPNEVEEQGTYFSLYGVGGHDMEAIRTVARRWLEKGTAAIVQPDSIANLK